MAFSETVTHSAKISADGKYRYMLTRRWSEDTKLPMATFVLLHPRTDDADRNGSAVRVCSQYARSWLCRGIVVVNLFAYRAEHLSEVLDAPEAAGPENRYWLVTALKAARKSGGPVVAAWGASAPSHDVQRFRDLVPYDMEVACFDTNGDGSPTTVPQAFSEQMLLHTWENF